MEKTKKKFDAVAMMREIRDQMSAEIEGMDYQEQKRYLSDRVRVRAAKEDAKQAERRITSGSS